MKKVVLLALLCVLLVSCAPETELPVSATPEVSTTPEVPTIADISHHKAPEPHPYIAPTVVETPELTVEPSPEPSPKPEELREPYDPFAYAPYLDMDITIPDDMETVDGVHMLTPYEISEFVVGFDYEDEAETDLIYSSDGDYIGFEDNFIPGCGWPCIIGYDYVAKASSTHESEGELDYSVDNAFDIFYNERQTAWVEGVDGYGIGESVTIREVYAPHAYWNLADEQYDYSLQAIFDDTERELPQSYIEQGSYYMTRLCIANGYAGSEHLWTRNSRVKTLNMYVNDELYAVLKLEDTIKPQNFNLYGLSAHFGEVMKYTFEIVDVYPGELDDTCISGIVFEVVGLSGAH